MSVILASLFGLVLLQRVARERSASLCVVRLLLVVNPCAHRSFILFSFDTVLKFSMAFIDLDMRCVRLCTCVGLLVQRTRVASLPRLMVWLG